MCVATPKIKSRFKLRSLSPHPEAMAVPMAAPMSTATIGLHQMAHPLPVYVLNRLIASPTAAPMPAPIRNFMMCLFNH